MTELCTLLMRYTSNEIDYAKFRRDFVPYIAGPVADEIFRVLEPIVSACDGLDDGLISENELKRKLGGIVVSTETSVLTLPTSFSAPSSWTAERGILDVAILMLDEPHVPVRPATAVGLLVSPPGVNFP